MPLPVGEKLKDALVWLDTWLIFSSITPMAMSVYVEFLIREPHQAPPHHDLLQEHEVILN